MLPRGLLCNRWRSGDQLKKASPRANAQLDFQKDSRLTARARRACEALARLPFRRFRPMRERLAFFHVLKPLSGPLKRLAWNTKDVGSVVRLQAKDHPKKRAEETV